MIRFHKRNTCAVLLLSGLLIGLTGCGSVNENISKGMESIKALDYETALGCFQSASELSEDSKLLYRGMGIAYMGLADYQQAADSFLKALSITNGIVEEVDFDINFYLGAAYTKLGQHQQAREIYDAILALRPQDKEALYLRGLSLLSLNLYTQAKADFDQAVSLDDKDYDRIIQIYEALNSHDYKDAGQGYLTDALQKYGEDMSAYDKGRMYYYMGDYNSAYAALEKAREEGHVDAYLFLGRAYEATGDYNYASTVYNSYLEKVEEDAGVYNQLGLCEMRKENYVLALNAFQSGMKLEDEAMMQALRFNEAVAYEYMGEYQKAAVLMEEYLKIYPDDENAKREYEFLATR
ncbi:MAG: tetratricopeptide repeat protein [Lachnospiraceae bacterium]|nr:tetratricopeptide repeat protein [Lachnospiraceae bacterium]